MSIWLVEPRDPLIARDGRPFGPDPGARAKSVPFPFPSTLTGGVRTRAGQDARGVFTASVPEVLSVAVRGPLLVEVSPTDEIERWLLPSPADAVVLRMDDPKRGEVKQLTPPAKDDSTVTNLPDGLRLVGFAHAPPELSKPHPQPPRFWYWEQFEPWLLAPQDKPRPMVEIGHSGPVVESRVHVSIQRDTQAAREGALFQTSGLEFARGGEEDVRLRYAKRLALAVDVALPPDAPSLRLGPGLDLFGGERRLARWFQPRGAAHLPACLPGLRQQIIEDRACRVLLVTPAYFEAGWKPGWLLTQQHGVKPDLKAVAIQRPQVVSGWDLAKRECKETRRLAPAGTVYWLTLAGDPDAIGAWVDAMWMQCVSDGERNRRDGFGLAVVGTWKEQNR